MADKAKIKIDGQEYEFPQFDSLTLDEAILMERVSGKMLDEVEEILSGDHFHAGVIKGLVHVAVVRARPDESFDAIAKRLGALTIPELGEAFKKDEPAAPLAEQPETETRPLSDRSGEDGADGGETRPAALALSPTGDPGSDATSTSDRRISAA